MTRSAARTYDVIVIGCGGAGLAAALSCAESGSGLRVGVLERADRLHRGGSTRWTGAYLRLADLYEVAPDFVEDCVAFSNGRSDEDYVRRLVDLVPETMEWLQEHGLRFRPQPSIFITRSKPRLMPVGGGEAIVEKLATAAEAKGVEFLYETSAVRLLDETGPEGLELLVRHRDGSASRMRTRAIVIACGGFEGNPEMLVQYLGPEADQLRNISEGGTFNKGEGIRMALEAGAMPKGEFGGFHAEPIDPRSVNPEPVVMTFPYGILVNRDGLRFTDEAAGTADEIYEEVAREIWRQPGHIAYLVADQRMKQVPNRDHALLTEKPAIQADSIADLAPALGLPPDALERTVLEYNAGASPAPFTPGRPDRHSLTGVHPGKSNWAYPLDEPPYIAYPVACSIVFTYGGIGTDTDARVLDRDGTPMDGLFAAGECTGLYYGKYPGATSVLRSLVFGRIAGLGAAAVASEKAAASGGPGTDPASVLAGATPEGGGARTDQRSETADD